MRWCKMLAEQGPDAIFASAASQPAANSASSPFPRLEWFVRVKNNNDNAAKVAGNIQLVFDGDSITDGWQGGGRQIWEDRYAKLGAFDFGISGDRTENVLWRLSQGQMNGIHPKLVFLMIGTNNGNPIEQVAVGVKAIIAQYRSLCPDAVILVQGIFFPLPECRRSCPRAHQGDQQNPRHLCRWQKYSLSRLGRQVLCMEEGQAMN